MAVQVPVVYDGQRPIAFGSPCDWAAGVAARVLSRELLLATVHFKSESPEVDTGSITIQTSIALENTGKIFLDFKAQTNIGFRTTQEDRFTCEAEMEKNETDYPTLFKKILHSLSFFAVYDGHGGEDTSEFLCQQLHKDFARELEEKVEKVAGKAAEGRGNRSCRVCLKAAIQVCVFVRVCTCVCV